MPVTWRTQYIEKTGVKYSLFSTMTNTFFSDGLILSWGSSGIYPSIKYWYCSSVSSAASCVVSGHDIGPSSKRLYKSKIHYQSIKDLRFCLIFFHKREKVYPFQKDFGGICQKRS